MKKVVAIILSLVLLLGLCSMAQAAVTIPPTFSDIGIDMSFSAPEIDVSGVNFLEVDNLQVQVTDDYYIVTGDFSLPLEAAFVYSNQSDAFTSLNWNSELNAYVSNTVLPADEDLYIDFVSIEWDDDGSQKYYTDVVFELNTMAFASANYSDKTVEYYKGSDGLLNFYDRVTGESMFTNPETGVFGYSNDSINYGKNSFSTYYSDSENNIHCNIYEDSANYHYFYADNESLWVRYDTKGNLTGYSFLTNNEDGSNLTYEYNRFGQLYHANYWVPSAEGDGLNYNWFDGVWYVDNTDEVADLDIEVPTAMGPYAEPYIANIPAAKLENVDISNIDVVINDDGSAYYYDGIVNAWYDEDGNLSHYFYLNLEGTEEYQFQFAPNGTLTMQQTYTEKDDGYFYLTSEIQYYANSGAPRSYYYVAETGEDVYCLADGTVESIHFYDEETGIGYGWDSWDGWYAWNDMGEEVAVDASAMPDPQSFKGPALVTVTAVTKDDVKVAPTAASATPTLPVALADLPTITGATLENNTLSISVSDELGEELNFYNEDDFQNTYLYVDYELDGEWYWADTLSNDVIAYSLESDPIFYYNTETKTYEFNLPEGAENVSYGIYVDRIIDNMTYYYAITEDGVNVSVYNDYLNDVSQTFYYEDGKLVRVYTSVDDYYLTTNYDEEGNLDSYRFPVAEDNHATFLPDGTLDYIRYYDAENEESIYWDATNGWHTREYAEDGDTFVPTAVEKPADAVDPEDVKPIFVISKKPQHIWFPKNTLGLAAVSMKDLGISSDWHNVAPVDLTTEGTTVFTLVGADAWILGQAYVTVADGNVTVDYAILDGHGYMKSEKMNWFLTKADLTEENLKAESNYAFGEPVSIADQLGGAETAILFIDSKITFRQPYFDAYNYSTRYYRNRENWKEYREGLIEMIGE